MQSEDNQSHTSDTSRQQPARFERESIYSSTCANMGAQEPPLSATVLPLRGSDRSAPRTSSRSFGLIPFESEQPDLALHQKTTERTLSALAEPRPFISQGPRPDTHGHRAVAIAGIYGTYPTIDLIVQCGRLGKNEPETLVSA